jgi:hypothetical protein
MKDFLRSLIRASSPKRVEHGVFLLVLLLLCLVGVLATGPSKRAAIALQSLVIVPAIVSAVYAGRWGCQRFFMTKQYAVFAGVALSCTLVIAGASAGGYAGLARAWHWELLSLTLPLTALVFFSGFFLALTRVAFRLQLREAQLLAQHRETELAQLRAQLHPHFLFNTLNNLYGLALHRPQQLPPLLLKLSDLLRYTVYQTQAPLVSLAEELAYLRNYMDLAQLRLQDRLRLQVEVYLARPAELLIAPQLLIVFVENAFKHAQKTVNPIISIHFRLWVEHDTLRFFLRNSCPEAASSAPRTSGPSGLGLPNVIQQLELVYPGSYQLDCRQHGGYYQVDLHLPHQRCSA